MGRHLASSHPMIPKAPVEASLFDIHTGLTSPYERLFYLV